MSKEDRHIEQYNHNLNFLNSGIKDAFAYPDWTVTVTFYCAVHLVEAMLAKMGQHSGYHSDRDVLMKKIPNIADFEDCYMDLKQLSRQARYDCVKIARSNLCDAQIDLDAIKAAYSKVS